jgi:hypothetical protein
LRPERHKEIAHLKERPTNVENFLGNNDHHANDPMYRELRLELQRIFEQLSFYISRQPYDNSSLDIVTLTEAIEIASSRQIEFKSTMTETEDVTSHHESAEQEHSRIDFSRFANLD